MDLFQLLGTISIENGEANKALDETSAKGQQTESKLGKVFSGIGKGAAVVGKAVGVGMIAAGTAVAGLVTKSTQAYAEYEQLVGGVDTLFKESSAKVQAYAEQAYETAGMSANEYMNTVTSFSASLLQSLGGDTEKAADKADVAIRDMSDNANKMGTSMESIQNAYQGFAKQNYTMLDNLKLGYGGTKEEMQRLLSDAEKLSGQKFDISSYADVVDAIHVVQTEMGITGTTAQEAAGTISGSMSSVKGAWTNLVTAMSSDDLPLDEYIDKFVESATTMVSNMLPRIEKALGGVVQLVNKLAPVIIGKIPELFSQLLPSVITAATGLVEAVVTILPDLVQALVDMIPAFLDGVVQIITAIVQALPIIVDQLVSALPGVIEMICAALPTLLPTLIDALVAIIVSICENFADIIQPLIDNIPTIVISVVEALMKNLPALIEGIITLVMALVEATPQIIESIIDAIPTIVEMIVTAILNSLPTIIAGAIKLVSGIVSALPRIMSSLARALPNTFKGIWEGVKNVFSNVGGWFGEIGAKVGDAISGAVKTAINDLIGGAEKIINGFFGMINGAIDMINNIPNVNISKIKMVEFTRLAEGGVVDKPTPAIFGEDGAEAVVPLENNTGWLNKVASKLHEFSVEYGGGLNTDFTTRAIELQNAQVSELKLLNNTADKILAALMVMDENMGGHLREALEGMSFDLNKREFARLVKETI